MKKYLEDLKKELVNRKVKTNEIEEILADLKEMIETALSEGLQESEINSRFGEPKKLAEELSIDEKKVLDNNRDTSKFMLVATFQTDVKTIKINVDLVFEEIMLHQTNESQISVYAKGKVDSNQYEISMIKDELTIKAPKQKGFSFLRGNQNDISFIVNIPRSIIISDFKGVGVSSELTIRDLNVEQLTLSTTSGDITINNSNISHIKVNTVSGDVEIYDSKFGNVVSSQVSGDLLLKDITINQLLRLHTVSGDVNIENSSCEEVEFHSVSGDLEASDFYPIKLSTKSVSGDVTISNKEKNKIEVLRKSSVSGEVRIN